MGYNLFLFENRSGEKAKAKFRKWIRKIKYLKRDEFNTVANSIQCKNKASQSQSKTCFQYYCFPLQIGKTICLNIGPSPEKSCDRKDIPGHKKSNQNRMRSEAMPENTERFRQGHVNPKTGRN